jgi:hypothetical protein
VAGYRHRVMHHGVDRHAQGVLVPKDDHGPRSPTDWLSAELTASLQHETDAIHQAGTAAD